MMDMGEARSPAQVLRDYFHAKDENRPHLLCWVFAPQARLEVINRAESMAFPALTEGRREIGDVLVRRFCQTYDNIYSFYLARPEDDAREFECGWLVGMSEKSSGRPRVGCGRYEWHFQDRAPHLAERLIITIEAMEVLENEDTRSVLAWLARLDYPWTSASDVLATAPPWPKIEPVLRRLR